MKLHLPKALLQIVLVAGLFAGYTSAAATPDRPYVVNTVKAEGTDITEDIKSYQGNPDVDNNQAYVKAGATATVTGDINMDTKLFVREGKLEVTGATITLASDVISNSDGNFYDNLVVAGNNAVLELNNAQIIQTQSKGTAYNKSMTVGNKDGEGTLIMKNGSVIKSMQLFHGGYYDYVNAGHGSYEAPTGDKTYFENDTPKAGHLSIQSGSKLYAGTGYMICDMDIAIDGPGSEFIASSRAVLDSGSGSQSWLGDADDCTTKVDITNGGAMKTYNRLRVSDSNAVTKITVTGDVENQETSLFGAYNRVSLASTSTAGTVSIDAKSNAAIHLTDATMSSQGRENAVSVSIDGTSSYTGTVLTINDGTTFKNDGTVELTDGTIVTDWRDDRNIGLDASLEDFENAIDKKLISVELDSVLTMNGGVFENNGLLAAENITLNGGDLVLGNNSTLELRMDGTAALVFGDGNLTLAENATSVNITLVIDGVSTFSSRSATLDFVLAEGNADSVNEFYALLDSETVNVAFKDTEGNELTGYGIERDEQGNVVVSQTIPEPTTATLSLLALAALAARRRRK